MKYIKSKKGMQLQEAAFAVMTVVLIAVLVIVSVYAFTALQTSSPTKTATVINETGTIDNTGHQLSNYSDCNFASPSITQVLNSDGGLVPASNYTLSGTTIKNKTTVTYTDALITYTYKNSGQDCNAIRTTINQFGTYPALLGLVGTVLLLAIVISVLVISFGFGGRKNEP